MEKLAAALVHAVTYISLGEDEREEFLDHDVGALEFIAAELHEATDAEQHALAEAAERALAAELAAAQPRPKFVHDFQNWMEEMLGEPWQATGV